jgi:hypothetical protein
MKTDFKIVGVQSRTESRPWNVQAQWKGAICNVESTRSLDHGS